MTASYLAFGGVLRSDLEIEELAPAPEGAAADWTLRVTQAAVDRGAVALGSDVVYGECLVRGYKTDSGYRLVFDDTGRFDVAEDGREIFWSKPEEASLQSAAADVTSRVIALALHAGGVYCLHASAVSVQGAGLAFIAPKFHGKSTICSALVKAGARAISDDTLPVRLHDGAWLAPGVPRLRLWGDTASRLFGPGSEARETGRKYLIDRLSSDQVETQSVPFRAAYVLNPVQELPSGAAVSRERLETVGATLALLMHAKLGPVLGGTEAPVLLSRAAAIATVVPVYALHVVRDLERVDEVARVVAGWHADEARPAGS
jgi:cytochrome c551/c552